jgi:type III pantothenate kinase
VLLVVDCGNTQTVIGLYEDPGDGDELVDHWRLSTNPERTADELALLVQEFLGFHGYRFDKDVHGLAVSSLLRRRPPRRHRARREDGHAHPL